MHRTLFGQIAAVGPVEIVDGPADSTGWIRVACWYMILVVRSSGNAEADWAANLPLLTAAHQALLLTCQRPAA